MKKQFTTNTIEIAEFLFNRTSEIRDFPIYYFTTLEDICNNAITFVSDEKMKFLNETDHLPNDILFIIPETCENMKLDNRFEYLFSANPKMDSLKMIKHFYIQNQINDNTQKIHPSAIIHPEAKLHPSVRIGAYSIVDKCEIGENSTIDERSHIYSSVKIGKNVRIRTSCAIGANDFSPEFLEDGSITFFPQIGQLVIEDNVDVFSFVHIGKGALGKTIIRKGAKIDNCCQIGHNTDIGENTVITANCVVTGSAKIGGNCWIGAHSVIKNYISIGDNITIGIGSVVTKSFEKELTIAGNPAMVLKEGIEQRKAIKKLLTSK